MAKEHINKLDPDADRELSIRIYVNPFEKGVSGNELLAINQHILNATDAEQLEEALDKLTALWRARAVDHIREEGTFKTLSDVARVIILGLPSATAGKRRNRESAEE